MYRDDKESLRMYKNFVPDSFVKLQAVQLVGEIHRQ